MKKTLILFLSLICTLSVAGMTEEERDSISSLLSEGTGAVPKIVTNARHARGATMAFARFTISGVSSSDILEEGLCWSTHHEPTVLDDKSTLCYQHNGKIYAIKGLTPATVYYVRPYAMTKTYAVGYGDELKIVTIPQSTATYEFDSSVENASNDVKTRIHTAIEQGMGFWHDLTSIRYKNITVYYNTGVPTAEASYSGYLAFGGNASYQRTGTALHEMAHTAGIGQTSMWINSSVLHPGSGTRRWIGERANEIVRFIENNDNAALTGDNTHMWGTGVSGMLSYGINGASEDSGSELQYIANCLVLQGCTEDGMCPNYWTWIASPCYMMDIDEEKVYYLTCEDETCGRGKSYLVENSEGGLSLVAMNGFEAMENERATWQLEFDPTTAFYAMKNKATGHYLNASYSDGVKMKTRSAGSELQHVQLMKGRTDVTIGSENRFTTHRGYWIAPNPDDYGYTLVGKTDGSVAYESLDLSNSATAQRWIVISEDEMQHVAVNTLDGTMDEIAINGETVPGVQNQYTSFNYAVAPGTEVSQLNVTASVKEAYPGNVAIELPDELPGDIVVNAIRNDNVEETYTIHVTEELLYNWNGRNTKGITPMDMGWEFSGNVVADVVNGADSTFHFVDADSEAQKGYLTHMGKTFSSDRILELPYLDDEQYTLHLHGLEAGRLYDFTFNFTQIYREANTQVSITAVITTADGTLLSEGQRTYASTTLKRFKRVTQSVAIPDGTDTSDVLITFSVKKSSRHILALGELSLSDQGEYVPDAIHEMEVTVRNNANIYNLQGMKMNGKPTRGLYIQNGRKILQSR